MDLEVPRDIRINANVHLESNILPETLRTKVELIFDPAEPVLVRLVFSPEDTGTYDVKSRTWYISRTLISNAILMYGTWSGECDVRVILRDDDRMTVLLNSSDEVPPCGVTFGKNALQMFIKRTFNVASVHDENVIITRWVNEFVSQIQLNE